MKDGEALEEYLKTRIVYFQEAKDAQKQYTSWVEQYNKYMKSLTDKKQIAAMQDIREKLSWVAAISAPGNNEKIYRDVAQQARKLMQKTAKKSQQSNDQDEADVYNVVASMSTGNYDARAV